jgi:RNA polymerase sigma-70 factor (ECF subfamily)
MFEIPNCVVSGVDVTRDCYPPRGMPQATLFVMSADDMRVLDALKKGDEAVFMELVERHRAAMLQVALSYTPSGAVAEEVVQETWLAVLEGLDRFEGRSSLKTWIFRILMNIAKRHGGREGRSVGLSTVGLEDDAPATGVELTRFHDQAGLHPGDWRSYPSSWQDIPEERLVSRETMAEVRRAIESLPVTQRQVITLRDVNGMTADEACNVLNVSEVNQRVLLHRARSKVRSALERYFGGSAK